MLLRVRVADAGLLDGTSFYDDISIHRANTLGELISCLTVEIVAATLRASAIHLGRGVGCRASKLEDATEQGTQGTQTADNHTNAVLSIAPDNDVANSVDPVVWTGCDPQAG